MKWHFIICEHEHTVYFNYDCCRFCAFFLEQFHQNLVTMVQRSCFSVSELVCVKFHSLCTIFCTAYIYVNFMMHILCLFSEDALHVILHYNMYKSFFLNTFIKQIHRFYIACQSISDLQIFQIESLQQQFDERGRIIDAISQTEEVQLGQYKVLKVTLDSVNSELKEKERKVRNITFLVPDSLRVTVRNGNSIMVEDTIENT